MSELIQAANLPQLTARIQLRKQSLQENILGIGHDLIEARKLVPYGQWDEYLKHEVSFTRATASKLMKCWERFGSNVAAPQHFEMAKMFELLALPSGEEEEFINAKAEEGTPIEDMTQKKLREEIKAWKERVVKLDEEHQKELEQKDKDHAAELDELNEQFADLEQELKDRPTVKPDDYDETKEALVEAKVALKLAQEAADRQTEDFQKQSTETADKLKKAKDEIKKLKERLKAKEEIAAQVVDEAPKPPLYIGNGINFTPDEPYKLLLTDPPYSTDVEDVEAFAKSWLPNALSHVRRDGFAYVFIGAYPNELRAYLNVNPPENISLCQVLVWTYRNTLGNNPCDRYKLNWQACLFYRGVDAPNLDCPITNEQWAVQDINAPDGRLGNRYHGWQKPDEIAERFIRHSTQKGDTVFDPFACTGTFLLAATKLGRKAYGFEINPDNAQIAFARGCTNGGQR